MEEITEDALRALEPGDVLKVEHTYQHPEEGEEGIVDRMTVEEVELHDNALGVYAEVFLRLTKTKSPWRGQLFPSDMTQESVVRSRSGTPWVITRMETVELPTWEEHA